MSDDTTGVPIGEVRLKLRRLKQRGCNLLVTGNVREEVSRRATRKLLGAPEVSRSRLLALTDRDREDAVSLLPDDVGVTDERVRFVGYDCDTRTAASSVASESVATDASQSACDLDGFQTALCNAMTTAKIAQSGLEPAEFRLSLYTLSYLVNRHDETAIDRFLSALGDHVRGVGGMAHYHLPVADDSKPVQRFGPLFDARIELREKNGRPEQRWHFPDDDCSTVWFGL
ncbi:DUF7504 family protein [Halorussus pelagicus]|uniref:DUF7504 family protein n=1 Tax=Halorussus pelagicus TaxID=2505977 RepID=UPI000FFBBA7A|nr:hypothetical protein [Halorussus pelagicus]